MEKTYRRIREWFYWKGMKQEMHDFVKRCEICQTQKLTRVKTKEPMMITDTPSEPFAKIAIDILGPLPITTSGNQPILPMQCLLSKFCIAVSIPNIKVITIVDALAHHFIAQYRVPSIILSDRVHLSLTCDSCREAYSHGPLGVVGHLHHVHTNIFWQYF